jgi:hypothetical protein
MKTNLKLICSSIITLGLFVTVTFLISSCGSGSASDKNSKGDSSSVSVNDTTSKVKEVTGEASLTEADLKTPATADPDATLSLHEKIAKAQKNANSVFLVVTDKSGTDLSKALAMARKANKAAPKSIVAQMNRDDAANGDLVKLYGVSSAPVPIILVISPSGVLAGGYLFEEASSDMLVKLIPSPKQDLVLKALNNDKSVFVVASKSNFTDKAKALEVCKAAVKQNGNKSEIVEFDLSDVAEKPFLESIGVKMASTTTVTVVANSKGQITGTFYEVKDAASLVTLANKVESTCTPGSCAKPCN